MDISEVFEKIRSRPQPAWKRGIAIPLWLNVWSINGPKWLLWLAPSIVLAFGMLVKGPFILIFFYSVPDRDYQQ